MIEFAFFREQTWCHQAKGLDYQNRHPFINSEFMAENTIDTFEFPIMRWCFFLYQIESKRNFQSFDFVDKRRGFKNQAGWFFAKDIDDYFI